MIVRYLLAALVLIVFALDVRRDTISEAQPSSGPPILQDEGVTQGAIRFFNFVGAGVSATRSGATGTITISSGAPTAATYITQTAHADLSAEQALGALSSGCLSVTTTTGVVASAGAACVYSGGPLGTPSSGTLTNATGLPQAGTVGLTTADSPQCTGVNVGHATDTTVTRSAAGVLAVEGVTVTRTIASGAKALATGAIASAACTTAQTDTATGTLTTDTITATFNGDPTAVTGYVPLTTGMLTIIVYPTADTFNAKVCNNTSSSVTPGAITLNWKVLR